MFEKYYAGVSNLLPREQFKPFPKIGDRKGWEALTDEYKQYMLQKAEQYQQYVWPVPPANLYMDFYRNGNRTRYENVIFNQRRLPLLYLVLGECIENKGRFVDDIINGIWSTLDEATWIIPAHNTADANGNRQPLNDCYNDERVYIDLFAAECGAVMAWCYYLLGERLDEEAPQVTARILHELNRRIIHPFLTHKEWGWMGYHGNPVNNWNPWITENIMTVATLACQDEETRAKMMGKCFECIEFFLNGYTLDGGCDEGPGYWNAAGGALFDCLEIAYDATNGEVNFFNEEIIHNICTYIYKMHINNEYVVNYADAGAINVPVGTVIYRMGKVFNDKDLKSMGAAVYHKMAYYSDPRNWGGVGCQVYRNTKSAMQNKEIAAAKKADFPHAKDVWFPGIQVMCTRMQKGSCDGLYLSAKGGTNGESHNHNDVGSFVIYSNGKPAIIDLGTGVYEKKTFSAQRYEIPQMQSLFHNLPSVNGTQQLPGVEYKASRVAYEAKRDLVKFSVGIEGAYPEEAGIETWDRSFCFDRKDKSISITDAYQLKAEGEVAYSLITAVKPSIRGNKMTLKLDKENIVEVELPANVKAEVEPFVTENDANLRHSWGKQAYRTRLYVNGKVAAGKETIVVRQK